MVVMVITLELRREFGVLVKEPRKLTNCSKSKPELKIPEKTEVKDPKKLTDQDRENIKAAIRSANTTIGGVSKLPNGTGFISDPAFIEFDKDGNVRIISPNDVEVDWDSNYNPVYGKNGDGSYKVKEGHESNVIKFEAKDLVKNLGPVAPTIEETDDKKQITVNPISNPADTDIIEHTVTYTGTDGKEKKIVAKQDLENETWSISEGSEFANIDSKTGLITIDKLKIKNETEVKALVQDNGEYVENSDKKYSSESKLKVTKTKADQVTELGGLDPVEIRKWVGEDIDWSKGIKVKKDENKDSINKLLEGATITDATDKKRNTEKEGDFVGKVSVKFDDRSELIVDNQFLYVSNHVTIIKRDKTPSDALEVEFKLGEGTKVDNTSDGAIEGNKENPTSYSKYKVKPGTNLKEYKLPNLNSSVVDSIKVTTQDTYTEPVWKDSKNGTNFVATAKNNIFIATATKTYEVKVIPNGGEGDDKVTIKKTGEKYKLPEKITFNPPNENQEFAGWMIGDVPGINKPGDEITVDGDKIIKAIWKPIEFKVTFKTEDGASGSMDPVTVKKGDEYVIPKPTFKPDENKEFAGWKIVGKEGLKKAEDKIDKISGDVTLIATWKNIQVKVSYDANGGSGNMTGLTQDKGSDYTVLPNAFKAPDDTQEFSHWDVNGETKNANDIMQVNGDTVIKAIWKKTQVKVSYDANGGSGTMEGKKVDKGSNYTVLPNGFKAPDDTQEFKVWEVNGKEVAAGKAIKIDKDTEIKALWKKIQVNVTYDGNGGKGTMVGKTVDKGSNYTVLENTFKAPDETQEFDTWEVNGEKVAAGTAIKIDKDTVIKALWKKIQVNVNYDANGGSGTMDGKKVDKGSDYTVLENTFKSPDDTLEFSHWEVDDKKVEVNKAIKIDKDTVIKAIWKKIQVKVSYDANGGSGNMAGATQNKGSKYTLLANTFKAPNENQEFDTWEVNGEKIAPGSEITLDKDTVVKAIWKDIEVKVSYEPNGGSGEMKGAIQKKGTKYTLSSNTFTAPENQEFDTWEVDGKKVAPNTEIILDKYTVVKAIWKDIEVKVTYDSNGGSGEMKGAIQKKGTKYNLSSNIFTAPENQEFDAWEVDGQKLAPNAEITLDKNTVVKAIWKDIEYKVTFNGNKGTGSMTEKLVKKGNEYELPANGFTAPENKIFSHWKIGNEDKNPGDKITVNGDTEVKAIWKDIKVNVSYEAKGGSGTMDGAELTKGSTYKLLANKFTAPENKEFAGWKIGGKEYAPDAEITVNEDTTVTAIWKKIQVNVTYDANGGSGTMEGKKVDKGSTYKLLANKFTAPKNKEFAGWKIGGTEYKPDAEITVNEDTIVTAIWKDKTPETPPVENYKVSFKTETGATGTMPDETVPKGKYTLPDPAFTAEKGKEFAGWKVGDGTDIKTAGSEIDITGNVILTAVWKGDKPETQPVTEKVKVIYEGNGGSGRMEGKELNKGSKYILSANRFEAPDKKKFKGWKIGNTEYAEGDEITVDIDTTVTAVWEDIETTPPVKEDVQVSYEPGEGSGTMDGTKLEKGSKYILSANGFEAPDKKKFKGWKIGDTEYAVGDEITVDKDTTVTAVWEDIETTPPAKEEVQVSYEPGEGSGTMDVAKLEKGSKYILSSNGFKAPANKKFKAWKIGDKEYAAGDEITVDKDTTVTAVWENVTTDPGKPDEGGNPDNPGTDPDQGGDNPKPGTTPDQGVDKPNPGTTPDQGGDNPNPGTNPDQGGDKPNPGKPGEVGDSENPDKKPEDGKDKPNPGATPGKDSESPRPGTKPSDGENKAKATDKDNSKKTEGNKENPLDNTKVKVPRTNKVKENVQTGVEPIGQIGGILSAAIAGLFAIKKRKK